MTIATLFLLLNPAAVATVWAGYGREPSPRLHAIAAAACFLALGLAVIVTRPLLDGLDTSDATFRVAAGVLVIFGALQAFLGVGLRHRLTSASWVVIALILWLVSPATLAAAMAVRVNGGILIGIVTAALAVLVTIALSLLWLRRFGNNRLVLLGWTRRLFAAAAAAGGVDLIRQGVLSI